jgi:hypothetical protein
MLIITSNEIPCLVVGLDASFAVSSLLSLLPPALTDKNGNDSDASKSHAGFQHETSTTIQQLKAGLLRAP